MNRIARKNLWKTLLCLILMMAFLLSSTLTAFAAAGDTITMKRYNRDTGKNESITVTAVDIYNNDTKINSDVPAVLIQNRTMVPVKVITDILDAKVSWNNTKKQATITTDSDTIVLTIGRSTAIVNGKSVSLPGGISAELLTYQGAGRTMIPFRFVSEQLGAEIVWNNTSKRVTINPKISSTDDWQDWTETYGIQVVIDAGHGGSDPGAVANNKEEKDINLEVAERVSQKLTKKGITVIMTRTEDEYIELVERAETGTESKATIFVSLHCNSATTTSATGIETYYYINSTNAYDKDLATYIQEAVIKATGARDRGVKSANLSVLRNSKIPAALVEMGFISNVNESGLLANSSYQNKIATGVTNGILNFLNAYDLR